MVHKSFYDVLQVDANAAIDEMLVGDFRYGFDLSKDGGYPLKNGNFNFSCLFIVQLLGPYYQHLSLNRP